MVPFVKSLVKQGELSLGATAAIILRHRPTHREKIASDILRRGLRESFGIDVTLIIGDNPRDQGLNFIVSEDVALFRDLLPPKLLEEFAGLPDDGYTFDMIGNLKGKTVVPLLGKGAGVLYGAYTLTKIMKEDMEKNRMRYVKVADYPHLKTRGVNIAMAWYLGTGMEGPYEPISWGFEEWKRCIDLLTEFHFNFLGLTCYGLWPFEVPGYEYTTARSITVQKWIGDRIVEEKWTHPNLESPFLSDLVNYARERDFKVVAYIGLNTYNGWVFDYKDQRKHYGFLKEYPESAAKLATRQGVVSSPVASCWSSEKAINYMCQVTRLLVEYYGLDGIVFESSETGGGMCICEKCKANYGEDERDRRINGDAALITKYFDTIKDGKADAHVGFLPHVTLGGRWPEDYLDEGAIKKLKDRIPQALQIYVYHEDYPDILKVWTKIFGKDRTTQYNTFVTGGWKPAIQLRLKRIESEIKNCVQNDLSATLSHFYDWRADEPALLWLSECAWLGSLQEKMRQRVSEELYGGEWGVLDAIENLEEAALFGFTYGGPKEELLRKNIPMDEVEETLGTVNKSLRALRYSMGKIKPKMITRYSMNESIFKAIKLGEGLRLYYEISLDYCRSEVTDETFRKFNKMLTSFSEAYNSYNMRIHGKFERYKSALIKMLNPN